MRDKAQAEYEFCTAVEQAQEEGLTKDEILDLVDATWVDNPQPHVGGGPKKP